MELENIFLAKFADITPDGLFTVHGGGLNRIDTERFPCTWSFLYLVARVRLTAEEAQGQHVLESDQEKPNGQIEPLASPSPLEPLPSTVKPGPEGTVGLTLCLGMVNPVFPEPGVYKFRVKIDGQAVGAANLLVGAPAQRGVEQ